MSHRFSLTYVFKLSGFDGSIKIDLSYNYGISHPGISGARPGDGKRGLSGFIAYYFVKREEKSTTRFFLDRVLFTPRDSGYGRSYWELFMVRLDDFLEQFRKSMPIQYIDLDG